VKETLPRLFRRSGALRFGSICALLLTVLAGCKGTAADESSPPEGTGAPGSAGLPAVTAPALVGEKAGGGTFSLKDMQGSPVVLVFYRGTFCGICTERLKQLSEFNQHYEAAGAKVVAVTLDTPETAKRASEALDAKYETVSAKPAVFRAWGIWKTGEMGPRAAAFVLDESGRVRFGHVGLTTADMTSDVELLGVVRDLQTSAQQASR
jgi:peroxiredoxin